MGRRLRSRFDRGGSDRIRLIPVWRWPLDRKALARALLLIAMQMKQPARPDATPRSTGKRRRR